MKKNELIAYAESFTSFVIEKLKTNIKEIILFGSVARGDFSQSSDIDLFFNVQNKNDITKCKTELKNLERKFYKSKIFIQWKQKGITNIIKPKIGILEQWGLKRSIISDGLVLYGKYKSDLKGEGYLLIVLGIIKDVTKRNKITRTLFGRSENNYSTKGLISEVGGKKLAPTILIIPLQFSDKIITFLQKEKISFQLYELWSDQF
ncbi:MAG: nucleotidyltransferase domain-containing protein [Nanoarchaeota archaeon]|nr:nucleotidyltransferase domain-containing protein [Nanoarchaeota archaeon]MBU1622285.1 nucleotidyltransferase domain-containing protein [Nanoarchaeota archaeon]MBU1973978.1 nucleotidyltransferase domain-containing protein [Nanoarchaeota archaeon]